MITRRSFLASTAAFGTAILASPKDILTSVSGNRLKLADPLLAPRPGETLITILHTNDTHSQIDPVPANDKLYPERVEWRGGQLYETCAQQNPNTL